AGIDDAAGLALRAVANGQHVERFAGGDERLPDPLHQGHGGHEDGDADADAEHGEQRQGAPHGEVAQVVLERDEHHVTSRSPAAMGRDTPRSAGMSALITAMGTASVSAMVTVSLVMSKCCTMPLVRR